ncbi:alpha/beta fold hydrolase [Streptomyces sp. CG1]|uniref:alpha/beta fold hydrolase n=1 Tax=Streptomyces sp. CG1 TaxID=1287523 RepID=UPI0034E2FA95
MRHRTLHVNGIDVHIAEAGEGPLVILLHGFPELWYSWRHQLGALAAAGFHVIAPDLRGYGQSTVPPDVEAYGMQAMVDDVVGMLDALDEPTAALVGHDWGAQIGWACAQLASERFPALASLSVPYHRRTPAPMTQALRRWAGDKFNWLLYFQAPGVAEAELQADAERSLRLIFSALSGDAPDGQALRLLTGLPADSQLLDPIPEPTNLPSWLAESDLSYYVEEFRRTGFTGALNRYRNVDRDWEDLPALGATPVRQPVLFVTGELDTATRFMDADAMRLYVPNLHGPVVLPGCGHWIQQERPHEVNALLVDFLSSDTVNSAIR